MKRHVNIPVFIPELACPFQCTFCNQEKITGYRKLPGSREIVSIIESHLATIDLSSTEVELAFFGGSFTGLPLNEQHRLLEIPQAFIRKEQIRGIRISTRPDYISGEILEMLKEMNVSAIELGAQSLDDSVLMESGRGHDVRDVESAASLIRSYDFELGLQMMIGLPGDTPEKSLFTARKIVALGADTTRIYPTLVIAGTALAKMYRQKKYLPLSLPEAVSQTKEIVRIFEKSQVKILRIGLHPSEGLISGKDFLAGPFHVNFKEMVMSEIWWDKIEAHLPENPTGKSILIRVPAKSLNFAIGYKARNKKRLERMYKEIRWLADPFLKDTLSVKFT